MRTLVTERAGHPGEALVRKLQNLDSEVVGLDLVDSPFTTEVGSIADHAHVKRWMKGVEAVIPTATLHKPISPRTRGRT
jgi:nucleoside-diphosphate-sugar epimerase